MGDGFAKEQPQAGQVVTVCEHLADKPDPLVAVASAHWFQLGGDKGIRMAFVQGKSQGAFVAHWFACCDSCRETVNTTGDIAPANHFRWQGDEPVIKDGRS
jgi:hypothetical protein